MTQAQQYHHYDIAGIYMGSTPVDFDQRDPGVAMPPPYGATLHVPPDRGPQQAAVFDGQEWALVVDLRGAVYWLADGSRHTIDDVGVELPDDALTSAPPLVELAMIPSITPRQIRQVLTASGIRAQVEAAVADGDQDLKDWWEFSSSFERYHPVLVEMATDLGLTGGQIDDLFDQAALL